MSLMRLLRDWLHSRMSPAMARALYPEHELMASREAITRFLFVEDPPEPADFCFVLGCPTPNNMDPAIALFTSGLVPTIVVSGHGPSPQPVAEAVLFRDYAVARGVPTSAILVEETATNTRENFIFSAPLIAAHFGWKRVRRVALVAKPFHMRRAIMTARACWPSHVRLLARPSCDPDDFLADRWWRTEDGRRFVMTELRNIGQYALKGDIGGF